MSSDHERREFLKWLGAGAVASLGLFAASCDTTTGSTGAPTTRTGGAMEYPFSPGRNLISKEIQWRVRTVDQQDLEEILSGWTLKVGQRGRRAQKTYTFAELVALPRTDMLVDFHCVEGWSVHDIPWNGVHLSAILEDMGFTPTQRYVTFHTIGGKYNESLPLEQALDPRTLLAYGVGGNTLPLKRGFPLRLVVPGLLAYKSAKYVETIEFTDEQVEGFWVARGYPYEATVPRERLRKGKF